jgi:hypothetical protein
VRLAIAKGDRSDRPCTPSQVAAADNPPQRERKERASSEGSLKARTLETNRATSEEGITSELGSTIIAPNRVMRPQPAIQVHLCVFPTDVPGCRECDAAMRRYPRNLAHTTGYLTEFAAVGDQ